MTSRDQIIQNFEKFLDEIQTPKGKIEFLKEKPHSAIN